MDLQADALAVADDLTRTRVRDCYQCGKCSAGCPMAERMDVLPNRLMLLVQRDRLEKALAAESLWQCVSCHTCSTRCPKSVDCAGVMDALRQLAAQRGLVSRAQQRTLLFQRAFLDNIRRNGRLNEVDLIARFKTRAFLADLNVPRLLKDSLLAPSLLKRGKFHLFGEKAKDRGVVVRIFERCENGKGRK